MSKTEFRAKGISLVYRILYKIVCLFHYLFYRHFAVRGKHLIPQHKPVIFLANHQNALMDAMAILYGTNKPIVFMARADIFKKPLIRSILYFLRIIPIYRPRDGMQNMSQNDASFHLAADILKNCQPMGMFPEGAFNPHKNLFPLKKGFARIAFMSEEVSGFHLDLQVVPVGIDYTHKKERNAELLVQFGEPIPLRPILATYSENPAQAYTLLLQKVKEGLSPLIINIQAIEYHETYMKVFELCEKELLAAQKKPDTHYNRFCVQQKLTEKMNFLSVEKPEEIKNLQILLENYYANMQQYGLNDSLISKKPNKFLWPFRIIGALSLIIVYWLLNLPHLMPLLAPKLVLPKIKDLQFVSSIKFAVWLFASFIYYPLGIILLACFVPNIEYKLLAITGFLLSGLSFRFLNPLIKTLKPYFWYFTLSKKKCSELSQKRVDIMKKIGKSILTVCFLVIAFSLQAQEEQKAIPKQKVKDKFSFGVLPTVAYDADLGFQYGGLVNLYDYRKPVTYPDYRQMWKVEISRYTKGSGVNQVYYDMKNILPHKLRLVVNLAYITEQRLDFFGFNGYQSVFNPDFIDDTSPDYKSRVFYAYERSQLRFDANLMGPLPLRNAYWLAGLGVYHTAVSTVDINKLNKGESDDEKLPAVPLLYDKYVDWGIIPQDEKDGGFSNYLKIGALYDTRDIEANASRGIWAEAALTYVPSFLFNDQVTYLKAELAFRQYLTFIPDKLTFAYRLIYQGTIAGHTPFYMQPYMINAYSPMTKLDGLGGARSMRGVMRNRVVGDGYVLGNTELRWKMFRTVFLKQNFYFALHAFADAGMVVQQINYDRLQIPQVDRDTYFNYFDYNIYDGIHPAAGLSLRIAMNENFILAIDYGFPLNRQDGQSGGLFINIGNLF